ncbi:MAG: H-NS histone family protein [Tahibacter sp.]
MALSIEKMTLDQLSALMAKAARRQQQLTGEHIAKVRAKVDKLIRQEGLSVADLFPSNGERPAKAAKTDPVKKTVRKKAARAKYQNPKDPSQTWVGRGKRPDWFHVAIKAGKKPEDLLIK